MAEITVRKIENNNIGQKLTIEAQTKYAELECFHMPTNCYGCPVGYQDHNCGRNIPWTTVDAQKRPETCRLTEIDFLMTEKVSMFFGDRYEDAYHKTMLQEWSQPEGQMVSEKDVYLGIKLAILDDLYATVEKEFRRQDNRAEKRLNQGKSCLAVDGQATGLEKALKIIDAKRQEIKEGLKNEEN